MVFGQPFTNSAFNDEDRYLSAYFMYLWSSFAKFGSVGISTVNNQAWLPYQLNNGGVSINWMELNPDPKKLGHITVDGYQGNNGFTPAVVQNCKNFWQPILKSMF
ncbi:unnamed protein product [Oppiella nova]|uniref:Carboxylesterase type B domain-containing protein n=1 Tax=Oppiella nova TaxID=334625 RepID=A0A7R9QUR8_9ACAR|nr:unnamed protein product [Oppiella nova]CAG2176305.1 unnamed protein product [Oppiella nova]